MNISLGFDPGDVIVVTGAGSGIGRAIAQRAAQVGLRVSAWDLAAESVAATVAAITADGGRAEAVTADVSNPADVSAGLAAAAGLGPVRLLVNNAGPSSFSPLDFNEALTVAVGSVREVTTQWLDSNAVPDRALVNIASVAGNWIGTSPDWYPAAKAAIVGYTRHLAAYRSDDVRANAVAPGMVDTPRLTGFAASDLGQRVLARVPLHRLATPDEIAWAALFLLSPLASYVNGALLTVDGGWTVTQ